MLGRNICRFNLKKNIITEVDEFLLHLANDCMSDNSSIIKLMFLYANRLEIIFYVAYILSSKHFFLKQRH